MEDASLIDAMKSNINYVIQAAAVHYRVPGTNLEPVTFDQHVAMWLNTDRKIRQIKHLAPNNRTIPTSTTTSSQRKDNATITLAAPLARIPDIPSAPVPTSSIGDPMDLSQAMAAVKGKSLKTEGVRDICDKWNLCHYCKQNTRGRQPSTVLIRKPVFAHQIRPPFPSSKTRKKPRSCASSRAGTISHFFLSASQFFFSPPPIKHSLFCSNRFGAI